MKKNLIIVIFILGITGISASQDISKNLDSLSKIYNFSYETLDKGTKFNQRYLLWVEQDLDHKNPNGHKFRQRVFLSHKDVTKNVVLVTNGYWSFNGFNPDYSNEITDILDANQIMVEHRYFPPSVPDSTSFDWKYLNIENSAADLHHVTEILKKIYKKKWLSTGISKSGQTSIYYKYFYPEDVSVTVPVVAPLNFSTEEKRVYKFLDNVGTSECRKKIQNFQKDLLKNKSEYLEIFKDFASMAGQSYDKAGGIEKGYELTVLEFSFAFWQWGHICDSIPDINSTPEKKIMELISVSTLDWISDQGIDQMQPFFYQAMSEIGMYGYDITPFKEWVSFDSNPVFTFTFPKGIEVKYNPESHRKIDCFIRHYADNMIFIVGGNDPWGATSVDLCIDTNSIKIIKKNGSHKTRIMNLPDDQKKLVIDKIKKWMSN